MNIYEFLMRPHWKKQEIRRVESTIQELYSCLLPSAVTYDKDPVQVSPGNQQEETIAKIDELERKLEKLKKQRATLIMEVSDAIDKLADPVERSVLTYYYVNREGLHETATAVGYSVRHMLRIKKSGLEHLSEIMSLNVT